METPTQDVPGYYVWHVPGKAVAIHLHLDVVDRLSAEVMRGYGAVPKRGAEVGGVLIGTVEPGTPTIVRVEDFEPVACEYKRGPSYLFTVDDKTVYEDAVERWLNNGSRPAYAVGYYRSNTREALALTPDDTALLEGNFPSENDIALLIKPFATKVSVAGLFFRENGDFQETSPLEFPFRRNELMGEEAPARRSMLERRPRQRGMRAPESTAVAEVQDEEAVQPNQQSQPARTPRPEPSYAVTAPTKSRRSAWVWMPLSLIFLLLGILLGFQTAISLGSRPSNATGDYALSLSVAKKDDNLNVRWDRQSLAVRSSRRGLLEIEDGKSTKPVELDTTQLQSGNIIYRNSSPNVTFRLTVYPTARVQVTETMEWRP